VNNVLFYIASIDFKWGVLCTCHTFFTKTSRSKVKYMGQNHNFCNIEDSNLIFGMHVYLMELHILSGERSRSSFKVKGQIYGSKSLKKGHCVLCFTNTYLVMLCNGLSIILFFYEIRWICLFISSMISLCFFACYILRPNVRVKQFNHLQRHLWRGLQS